jgi:hypothetical protein
MIRLSGIFSGGGTLNGPHHRAARAAVITRASDTSLSAASRFFVYLPLNEAVKKNICFTFPTPSNMLA